MRNFVDITDGIMKELEELIQDPNGSYVTRQEKKLAEKVAYDQETAQDDSCIYMKKYTSQHDLLTNATTQDAFLMDASYWEGKFARHMLGLNVESSLTYDGIFIDYYTGVGIPSRHHDFSAASKESVHLGLLALALDGHPYAINFFNSSAELWTGSVQGYVLDQLTRKITSYEDFNKNYPGFGGFLPWYIANDTGIQIMSGYWSQRVPSLDNGEMIWGMVAVYQKLKDLNQTNLATRYKDYLDLLEKNALTVFMDMTNNDTYFGFRTVSVISDIHAQPTPNIYSRDPGDQGLLNDPYEGELFVIFADLFSDWTNFGGDASKARIWSGKQKKEKIRHLQTPSGNITVEQGWEFSSHEKWKYMELPYFDSPIVNQTFLNGEKARTWFSYMKSYAGMFAAVTDYTIPNTTNMYNPDYIGEGISPIAENPTNNTLVTPYAAFPLLLHPTTRPYGIVWYANMLNASRMQGSQGSTESISLNGQYIGPINTWDSKITSVLAFCGGIYHITRTYLNETGTYQRFYGLVNNLYNTTFYGQLQGTNIEFKLPSTSFTRTVTFTTCEDGNSTNTCHDSSSDCDSYIQFCTSTLYHKNMCDLCKKTCGLCNDPTC